MLLFSRKKFSRRLYTSLWMSLLSALLALIACGQTPSPVVKAPPKLSVIDQGPFVGGQAIALRGDHFTRTTIITLDFDHQPLQDANHQPVTARSDSNGSFEVVITIGTNWSPGTHTLTAIANKQQASAVLSVVAPTPTPTVPPNATPTSPPAVGQLYVAPLTATTNCGETRGLFQITNTGNGTLGWELSFDSTIFTITPTQGSLDPNQSVILVVTMHQSGENSITIQSNVGSIDVQVEC